MGNIDDNGIPKHGRDGNWKIFSTSSQILEEYNYLDGELNGKFLLWYENGLKKIEKLC